MFLEMHGTCLNFKYILCLHELWFGDYGNLQSSNFIIYISEPYGHVLFLESLKTKFFLVCGELIKEAHHQKKKNVLGVHPTNFYMLVLKFTHLLESCLLPLILFGSHTIGLLKN